MLSQLGYVVARTFRAVMAEVELEPRHFAVLRAIEAADGPSQNFLVELLRIPASSMVALLDHLEQRGLVARHVHPTDRRSRTVHLTTEGRVILRRASEKAVALESAICEGLSSSAREQLIQRLQLVGRNLAVHQGVHPGMELGENASSWPET